MRGSSHQAPGHSYADRGIRASQESGYAHCVIELWGRIWWLTPWGLDLWHPAIHRWRRPIQGDGRTDAAFTIHRRHRPSFVKRLTSHESLIENSQLTRLTVLCMECLIPVLIWIERGDMKPIWECCLIKSFDYAWFAEAFRVIWLSQIMRRLFNRVIWLSRVRWGLSSHLIEPDKNVGV